MVAVRILGIDPGTVVVGYACLEIDELERDAAASIDGASERPLASRAGNLVRRSGARSGRARLVDAGVFRLGRRPPVGERLARLASELEALFARCEPDELALEEAFFGRSVQAALRIGEARGVVLATAVRAGLAVHQYPPATVKRTVAGHGSASKDSVARMASLELGVGAIHGPADVGDAVAVAICHLEQRRVHPAIDGRA